MGILRGSQLHGIRAVLWRSPLLLGSRLWVFRRGPIGVQPLVALRYAFARGEVQWIGGPVETKLGPARGVSRMAFTIEAVYEEGVLKPAQPLPLKERQRVQVTIHASTSRARQTAGLLRWTGDLALLERFIADPELDPPEGP